MASKSTSLSSNGSKLPRRRLDVPAAIDRLKNVGRLGGGVRAQDQLPVEEQTAATRGREVPLAGVKPRCSFGVSEHDAADVVGG